MKRSTSLPPLPLPLPLLAYLRGLLYRRTRTLDGMLPRKLNEVLRACSSGETHQASVPL